MPPHRSIRLVAARGAAIGAARGVRGGRSTRCVENVDSIVEMELADFRTSGEKRGRQAVARMGGQSNSGFQGRPFQRSRFSQSEFSAPATNFGFSTAGSVSRPFNGFGRSQGGVQRMQGNGGCLCLGRTGHKIQDCLDREGKVQFLGHVISGEGISVDPQKVEVVMNWKRPTSTNVVADALSRKGKVNESLNEMKQVGVTFGIEVDGGLLAQIRVRPVVLD
ncbi:hypothetical protein LIER_30615 [Lithospermum erythrorhizon]|uniref:Uncharacterized protein n=1 Tax=Lithospermum erythrorhizon TaxID=34254 RepID=A0AAV3RRY9_LITER